MRSLDCLRCGMPMRFGGKEKVQLGQTGWLLGDLPNLLAGALEMEIYYCPGCGKMEFYTPERSQQFSDGALPQKKCPRCGMTHDFDYPKCPHCEFDYFGK